MKLKNGKRKDKEINTDPLGSWTGTPENLEEMPIQDADDL